MNASGDPFIAWVIDEVNVEHDLRNESYDCSKYFAVVSRCSLLYLDHQ